MSSENLETGMQNAQKSKKTSMKKKKTSNYFWGYLMIAPLMIGLIIFNIIPIIETAYYSFNRYKGFEPMKWIGLKNYTRLLMDPNLLLSLKNTLIFALIMVPLSLIISTVVAALLNSGLKGAKVFRTIYFLPQVTLPAAIAMAWMWLYNSDYGLINQFLSIFHIPRIAWISSTHTALSSVAIVSIWASIGYNMIIIISGLKGIPSVYYEAAKVDGANGFHSFRKITIPLLSPTLFFLMVTSLINAMEVFDLIWIMIGKNSPAINSVRSMVYTYYENAFIKYDRGYAASIAMVLFIIIMIITAIQLKLQKKWVYYE